MGQQRIVLAREDQREGMRLLRVQKALHDALHAAENEYQVWAAQTGAMYEAPDGWILKDIMEGFVPAEDAHGS